MRFKHTFSYAFMAFIATLLFGHMLISPLSGSGSKAMANSNVQAFNSCMASCRAKAKACYASGKTGSCQNQQISCFASCQSLISSGKNKRRRLLPSGMVHE